MRAGSSCAIIAFIKVMQMKRILQYTIETTFHDRKIYDYLLYKGFSAKNIIYLKKIPESILLNGSWVFVNVRLKAGDQLTIQISELEVSDIAPIPMKLSILFEDEDCMIVDKPWGMPSIPSMFHHEDSLGNGICAYFSAQGEPFVFRPVNRIDKNTSSLILIAKHVVSASMLANLASKGNIHKTYKAIVSGILPSHGTIDAPIARLNDSLITRCVDYERGAHAVTHYKVISQKEKYALISLCLETGRTHQIRVHFNHIGHPLVGDDLYGGDCSFMIRHALHAETMEFIQPLTGEPVSCKAPMPADMLTFWENQLS